MITSVSDWLAFLRGSEALMGVPLLAGGVALMLFGWRMWKMCVVLSFGLIGAAIGTKLADSSPYQLLYAIGCGAGLAVLSYRPANYSLAALGGLIGGGFVINFLTNAGLSGTVLWIAGGLALCACAALAFLNRQLVVIGATAFIGAVLLMSGLTVFAMSFPTFYATLYSMGKGSIIVLPFLLLVPMVMSCFYQIAEVRRVNAEL